MSSAHPAAGSLEDTLERHERQRAANSAVISCLVGPLALGIASWKRWCAARNRPVVLLCHADREAAIRQWSASVARQFDLPHAAVRLLAKQTGRAEAELTATLTAMSNHDRCRFLDGLAFDIGNEIETCGRRLLLQNLDEPLAPELLADEVSALLPLARRTWQEVVRVLSGLLPNESLPSLLIVSDTDPLIPAGWLAALAECVPGLPVALAVESTNFHYYLTQALETHALAMLRDGRINIAALDETTLRCRLETQHLPVAALESSIRRLAADGVDETLADTFATAVRCQQPPLTEERAEEARSLAEQLLFDLLQMRPTTAELFKLNAGLGFLFGRREAEADLYASTLRLVIELDGYYHFQNAEAYRRDRRKDWEMQRHGFTVLRFLSDDVTARLEETLDTIQAAVDHCRKQSASPGDNRS